MASQSILPGWLQFLTYPGNPAAGGAAVARQTGRTEAAINTKLGRQTLTRVAEGILGILLIIVGVAKLAEGSPLARTVAKAGLLA